MQSIADAIRKVTARMQELLERDERSSHIDAHDLIDLLLAIADELDPPIGRCNTAPAR
jgi:hypothetical protein